MVIASQAAEAHSAVFFMDGVQVARQMRLSEFGAFLDGYVGLSDLAETEVRAVLVNLNPDLTVAALVFFNIWFDEEGQADRAWNVPIEALAEQGSKGPDLGGGPIRLVCRSQTPDAKVKDFLWDPDMTPGHSHFHSIRKSVQENSLRFHKVEATAADIPTLDLVDESLGDEDSQQRSRMAQLLREHRLRIKTLQSVHRDVLSDLRREHRVEMQALRSEFLELEQQYERLKHTNGQMKLRLAERNEQYLSMQQGMAKDHSESGDKTSAELVLLREQLERKQRELQLRDETIDALERENDELKNREPLEGSILAKLQDHSVFLVAYHHGVGHISLPAADISAYFKNPVAYAAERCGLSESAYQEWLEHYEHPHCMQQNEAGVTCAEPIVRVTQPAEFKAGIDDRCDAHKP
ncbi:DNA repair protein [Marinobacter sp. MDS2]|uniref:DNA repair protein n=1 Tax=Marinobacter sp. MDS2 TaxID=3065961 RepID=UPI00273CB5C3|nr:DNA repair protein [Marinobacter sp. MDS2]MDP4548619.1 DNA repair protein [Marinobacter sp. MDS2]